MRVSQSRKGAAMTSKSGAGGAITVEDIDAFGRAWGKGDLETLMSYMADDCVFKSSVGPEPGETFVGKEEVRRGFKKLLAHDSNAVPKHGPVFVFDNKALAYWSFVYDMDCQLVEVCGVDIFEFEGRKITSKNAFRKTFPPEK